MDRINYQKGLQNPEINRKRAGLENNAEEIKNHLAELLDEITKETAFLNEEIKDYLKMKKFNENLEGPDMSWYQDLKIPEVELKDRAEFIEKIKAYMSQAAEKMTTSKEMLDRCQEALEQLQGDEENFKKILLDSAGRNN